MGRRRFEAKADAAFSGESTGPPELQLEGQRTDFQDELGKADTRAATVLAGINMGGPRCCPARPSPGDHRVRAVRNAPPSSRHYHDNPTPGDLNGYSLILMCGVGVGLALWGYTRNDPRRREWRRNHDGSDD